MTHTTIAAIVYADDKYIAKAKARDIFGRLTEGEYPFNYYTILGRPIKAESKRGRQIIEGDSGSYSQCIQ